MILQKPCKQPSLTKLDVLHLRKILWEFDFLGALFGRGLEEGAEETWPISESLLLTAEPNTFFVKKKVELSHGGFTVF